MTNYFPRAGLKILASSLFFISFFPFTVQAINIDINARATSGIQLNLTPGTYDVVPIGPADGGAFSAATAWSFTTCSNPSGCVRTSPTSFTGWLHLFEVVSPDLTSVSVNGTALTPVLTPPTTPNLDIFFQVSPTTIKYRVGAGFVYPDPSTAFSHALSSQFTLGAAGNVQFLFPDGPTSFGDNSGGLSLRITPKSSTNPIPEPSTFLLLGSGLAGLIGWQYRKKQT